MDISALVHPADIDVPKLPGLPDSPSSISSSITRPLPTSATSRDSSSLDDEPALPPPPMFLHAENGFNNYTEDGKRTNYPTFPSLQELPHDPLRMNDNTRNLFGARARLTNDDLTPVPMTRPLPPMLAPLTFPPLPSPISPRAPSPSIRRVRGTRPRPFVCWCGSAFSKREHLKRHDMLVHKALRPYRCQVCQVDFGTKQNMQVHFTTRKHRDREMFIGGHA